MMVVMVTNRLVVPRGDVSRSKNGNTGTSKRALLRGTGACDDSQTLCLIPWQKEWRYGISHVGSMVGER